jgi:hypothetical protein
VSCTAGGVFSAASYPGCDLGPGLYRPAYRSGFRDGAQPVAYAARWQSRHQRFDDWALLRVLPEAVVLVTKVFSSHSSDAFMRHKPLVLLDCGLASPLKPLFPFAKPVSAVVTARPLDHLCNGIRGAPRNASISEIARRSFRGASFGLRLSMDTLGAVLGRCWRLG